MKNKIIAMVLFSLLIPNLVLASWWNPRTWFKKDISQLEELKGKNIESFDIANQKRENIINVSIDKNSQKTNALIQSENLQGKLQMKEKENINKDIEINSLKKILKELQKNLTLKNPELKQIVIEKVVYQDKIIEKPVEKIIYKDKIIEKLIEKIVYRDRIVEKIIYRDKIIQASCDINTTNPTQTSYSDYNFDQKWTLSDSGSSLSCAPTARSTEITKAIFKISNEDAQRFANLRSFDGDDVKYGFSQQFFVSGKPYILEKKDENTFQYVGVAIPLDCSSRPTQAANIQICGGLSDNKTNLGRNMDFVFASKGIIDPYICIQPIIDWEVYDGTTKKPVKIIN